MVEVGYRLQALPCGNGVSVCFAFLYRMGYKVVKRAKHLVLSISNKKLLEMS